MPSNTGSLTDHILDGPGVVAGAGAGVGAGASSAVAWTIMAICSLERQRFDVCIMT